MPASSSDADKLIRSPLRGRMRQANERRRRRLEEALAPPTNATRAPVEAPAPTVGAALDASSGPASATAAPAPRLESELGEATYTCSCGFVFNAAVLTSVSCPHCGDAQAW